MFKPFVLLNSFLFGSFLSLLYTVFSCTTKILKIKKYKKVDCILQFVLDMLFFVLISPLCAIFMYGINLGIIRWYIVICVLLGYAMFEFSIGKLINKIFNKILMLILKIFGSFRCILKKIFKRRKAGQSPA